MNIFGLNNLDNLSSSNPIDFKTDFSSMISSISHKIYLFFHIDVILYNICCHRAHHLSILKKNISKPLFLVIDIMWLIS